MHIGRLIESEFRRQGRRVSWLAGELNMVRVNVYDIFKRESIDTALLQRISRLLNHNFVQEVADETERQLQE